MKRFISPTALLLTFILFWACPPDIQESYEDLEGKIVFLGDAQLSNAWIGTIEPISTYPWYFEILDSARTDSDGTYFLPQAVPELWENTTGCSASPSYIHMRGFALLIVPENRDTSFIIFYSDSAYYDPNQLSIMPTQVFIGEHHFGGEPGNIRQAPDIVLEY